MSSYIERTAPDVNSKKVHGVLAASDSKCGSYLLDKLVVVPNAAGWTPEEAAARKSYVLEGCVMLLPVAGRRLAANDQIVSASYRENKRSHSFTVTVTLKINGKVKIFRRDYAWSRIHQTILPDVLQTMNLGAGCCTYHVNQPSAITEGLEGVAEVKKKTIVTQFLPVDPQQREEKHSAPAEKNREWDTIVRDKSAEILNFCDGTGEDGIGNDLGVLTIPSSVGKAALKNSTSFCVVGIDSAATTGKMAMMNFDTKTGLISKLVLFHSGEVNFRLTPTATAVFERNVQEQCSDGIENGSFISAEQSFHVSGSPAIGMKTLAKAHSINDPEFIRDQIKFGGSDGNVFAAKGIQYHPKRRAQSDTVAAEALALLNGEKMFVAVAKAMQEGFLPQCISLRVGYPQSNGAALKAIETGVRYANDYLGQNMLQLGVNVFPIPESQASGMYITNNPPGGVSFDTHYAVVDIGHSTTDIFLNCNGKEFSASIPFAGRDIVERSLTEAFGARPDPGKFDKLHQVIANQSYEVKDLLNDMDKLVPKGPFTNPLDALRERQKLCEHEGFASYVGMLLKNVAPVDSNDTRLASILIRSRLALAFCLLDQILEQAKNEGSLVDSVPKLDVLLVGNGSRAFDQVLESGSFRQELEQRASDTAGIPVFIYPGQDPDKRSVAFGMLEFDHQAGSATPVVPAVTAAETDLDEYLVDLAGRTQQAERMLAIIRDEAGKKNVGKKNAAQNARKSLKQLAFRRIASGFRWDDYVAFLNEVLLPPEDDTFDLNQDGFIQLLVDENAERDFLQMPAKMAGYQREVMDAVGCEELTYRILCVSCMVELAVCSRT